MAAAMANPISRTTLGEARLGPPDRVVLQHPGDKLFGLGRSPSGAAEEVGSGLGESAVSHAVLGPAPVEHDGVERSRQNDVDSAARSLRASAASAGSSTWTVARRDGAPRPGRFPVRSTRRFHTQRRNP